MTTSTPWREYSLITHHLQRDKVSNYYCCCECGFEHECLGYISEMGEINETIFAKIVQSVVDGKCPHVNAETMEYTRGVQYVMKTAQYISKFYIYTLHNYFH